MPNNAPSLWRLTPRPEAPAQIAEMQLQDALRLHLRYRPLTSVLMRIGDMCQQYVVVHGCAGCAHERCLPGCATEMLRRALAAYAPGWAMQVVPHGLATRPYTRVRYAIPRQHAQTLDAACSSPGQRRVGSSVGKAKVTDCPSAHCSPLAPTARTPTRRWLRNTGIRCRCCPDGLSAG
ncbi:hypothetical protein HC891_26505 [Candidatus Gracilibacteria bacterium]|nr:hypothetical protein [Candidatus Gracilibacteria bacterium]